MEIQYLRRKTPKAYGTKLIIMESAIPLPYNQGTHAMNSQTIWKTGVPSHIITVTTKPSLPIYLDQTLDSKVTEDEVLTAARRMNRNSATKCGIPVGILLSVIYPLLGILTLLLNKVFLSTYPESWVPFIFCLPKKGKLNIPNVRGISIKPLLAKLYDAILSNRLQRWLKIPEEQTAYQKGKGCSLHVFFLRYLIATCKTIRKPIFVGVTDFEAAFDYISRRNLFVKLVNLGIGMFMLRALIEMYKVTDAFVLLNGDYSHNLSITAGCSTRVCFFDRTVYGIYL